MTLPRFTPALRLGLARTGALLALLGLCLSATADTRLYLSIGDERWSQRVRDELAPRTHRALSDFDSFAQREYGLVPDGRLAIVLASLPRSPLPEGVDATGLSRLEAGMSEAELRLHGLGLPLQRCVGALLDQAAGLPPGSHSRLPGWVRLGAGELVAKQLMAGLELTPLSAEQAEPPMTRSDNRNTPEAERALTAQREARQQRRLSLLAMERLQQTSGERFHAQLKAYAVASAQPDFDPERAFESSFGLGMQEHLGRVDAALRACDRTDLPGCGRPAPASAPDPDAAHVLVQMGGHVHDGFADQVEQQWLPVVQQAAAQFDRLVTQTLRVRLGRDARVYVAAGAEDYEQVLHEDMALSPAGAQMQSEVSGGLSNSRGQIALKFTPPQTRPAAYEMAVKTTLHELTHELQKQLDHNHAGFRPPIWLREGTADLFAYMLAPQVRINEADAEAMRNWRERNLAWWRNGNKTKLQPDEMWELSPSDWTHMMKEHRGNYQMAGLMCMYLQAILGERFLGAWVNYYRMAGDKQRTAAEAFEKAFGFRASAFQEDFKSWLAQQ